MKLEPRITRILKTPYLICLIFIVFFRVNTVRACIWDADTLSHEKSRSHDLATAILGPAPAAEDPQMLRDRIKDAEANRKENDPDWWNNLAGAYMRLNQPEVAVKLLEPEVVKFPNDYGIHANLGTAYHLLGRYAEAEKEIARDLEINPDAHFGLEKYHLALLQYLCRGTNYQARHLYVDQCTLAFFEWRGGMGLHWFRFGSEDSITRPVEVLEANYAAAVATNADQHVLSGLLEEMAATDAPQPVSVQWDLAENTNLEAGVIYMAEMNQQEPACYEMLGMVAWKERNINLAISAFEKAIKLGSLKTPLLEEKISDLQNYKKDSAFYQRMEIILPGILLLGAGSFTALLVVLYLKIRAKGRAFFFKNSDASN